jgi:hypothetical protein
MDKALKVLFVPSLRLLGFKGTYPHFRREGPQYMELLGIQFSQWGAQFYIELSLGHKEGMEINGKLIPAKELKYYHCWLSRERIRELPFDYEHEDVQQIAKRVCELIPTIDQWFLTKRGLTS